MKVRIVAESGGRVGRVVGLRRGDEEGIEVGGAKDGLNEIVEREEACSVATAYEEVAGEVIEFVPHVHLYAGEGSLKTRFHVQIVPHLLVLIYSQ